MEQVMTATEPCTWHGRYQRIPGQSTAFHVRRINSEWRAVAQWEIDDEIADCPFVDTDANLQLAAAVVEGKQFLSGEKTGGSFLINEFGDVLVPSPAGYDVARVGSVSGSLPVVNSFTGEELDLASEPAIAVGDRLGRPYIGMRHNLSKRNEIYFWDEDDDEGEKLTPDVQDDELVRRIRRIRPRGPIRFIAMYGGLLAMKVPAGSPVEPEWHPHYIGKLNFDKWFERGT